MCHLEVHERFASKSRPILWLSLTPMKTRRVIVFLAVAIAAAAAVSVALTNYWERRQPVFKNGPKLMSAIRAFSQDTTARGQPLPPSVSLRELVDSGYLATGDVRAFEGMDVRVSFGANEETPQALVMWARLPDGTIDALIADGSVQQYSPSRFEAYLKQTGQTGAPGDTNQPVRSETNQPSSATGLRR